MYDYLVNRDQRREQADKAKREAARDRRLAELRPTFTRVERLLDMMKSPIGDWRKK